MSMGNAQLAAPLDPHERRNAVQPHTLRTKRRFGWIGVLIAFLTFFWAAPIFSIMVLAHPLVLLLDKKRRRFHDYLNLIWAKLTLSSVGLLPRVVGREHLPPPGMPVIYAANHQSYADIFSLASLNRIMKFVTKSEILRLPTIGWSIALGAHVVVRRGDRRSLVATYKAMLRVIRDGNALAIFPEGTRSHTGALREFQPGAFKASVATGVPIVPVTVRGTRELMPSGAYLPTQYPKSGLSVVVHPMIWPEGKSDQELSRLVFDAINSALPPEIQARHQEEPQAHRV